MNSPIAPYGVRVVICLIGRRNTGKSSLINALTEQEVSIVSEQPGTTTDPVAKAYELLPFGPVTFYDTAGFDDFGDLGEKRIKVTRKILFRADMVIFVADETGLTHADYRMIAQIRKLGIPLLTVFNKTDIRRAQSQDMSFLNASSIRYIEVSAKKGYGIRELKDLMIETVPQELRKAPVLLGDLIRKGETVVCVVPIDLSAPKGRLILPQVQVLREILDLDAIGIIVKEKGLNIALLNQKERPAIVITDSQVIQKVSKEVPDTIHLTTFSILFARYKGDLKQMVRGAEKLNSLTDGDRILIAEACSHHIQADDIGRVKIPQWITEYTGKKLDFEMYSGHDFPENLEQYSLVIHCGACMLNRMEMIRRINECRRRGVPFTNYGIAISKVQGVLSRVIEPFSEMDIIPSCQDPSTLSL